jgi:hypothetical protein
MSRGIGPGLTQLPRRRACSLLSGFTSRTSVEDDSFLRPKAKHIQMTLVKLGHESDTSLEHHAAAQAFAHPGDRQLGPTSGMPAPWHCSRESGEQARIDSLSQRDERYEDPTGRVDHPLEWPMRA